MSGLGHYWVDITKATATFRQCLDFVRTLEPRYRCVLQQVAFHQVRLEGLLKIFNGRVSAISASVSTRKTIRFGLILNRISKGSSKTNTAGMLDYEVVLDRFRQEILQ